MSGRVIPASTCRNVVSFGRIHPVIMSVIQWSVQLSSVCAAAPDR